MTTISRLNATLIDHQAVANAIALGLLVSLASVSAAAINYSGNLAKQSYDTLILPAQTEQTVAVPAAKTQTAAQTSAIELGAASPLSLQSQADVISRLQPATGAAYMQMSAANTLQAGSNGMQLAGGNLQDAQGIL